MVPRTIKVLISKKQPLISPNRKLQNPSFREARVVSPPKPKNITRSINNKPFPSVQNNNYDRNPSHYRGPFGSPLRCPIAIFTISPRGFSSLGCAPLRWKTDQKKKQGRDETKRLKRGEKRRRGKGKHTEARVTREGSERKKERTRATVRASAMIQGCEVERTRRKRRKVVVNTTTKWRRNQRAGERKKERRATKRR